MAIIKIPSNKPVEFTDLEIHVIMCEQRRLALEEKIDQTNKKMEKFEEQHAASKKLIYGAVFSIITGICSTILSIVLHYYNIK